MASSRFDRIVDRTGTGSEKWERYAGRDVLPMWVADMDFETAPPVIEALERRARHGVFGYTVPTRSTREAVAAHCASRYSWEVDPAALLFFTGVNKITAAAVRALTEPGDGVIVCTPVYPPLHLAPASAGRKLIAVPLLRDAEYRYSIDFDALDRAAASARLLILCNPHNPVGRVWSREELVRIAEICNRHQLHVMSDEIFADLTLDAREHIPYSSVAGEGAMRLVTGMSASKTFNLAGLSCAFAIVPDPAIKRRMLSILRTVTAPDLNAFAYVATEAALREGEPWRRELVAYLAQNRDAIAATVARDLPEVRMTPVESTFLAWFDVTALGLENPYDFFAKAGIGFSDGRDFLGSGHVRMNFGCPRATLDEGLRRLKAAVQSLRAGTAQENT